MLYPGSKIIIRGFSGEDRSKQGEWEFTCCKDHCQSKLMHLLPDKTISAPGIRKFWMGIACFWLFGSLLCFPGLTILSSFLNYLQHGTLHLGNFLSAKFHSYSSYTFSEHKCLVNSDIRFWCLQILQLRILKKEKIYHFRVYFYTRL